MCDLLPAGKDSNIISFVFKREVPEEVAGLGGLISALIASYQAYKSWFLRVYSKLKLCI